VCGDARGGRRDGRTVCEVWVDRWAGGFANVDNVFLRLGGFAKVLDMKNGYKGGA